MTTKLLRRIWPVAMVVMMTACGSNGSTGDPECSSDAECDPGICVDGTCQHDDNELRGDGAYLEACDRHGDCASGRCVATDDGGRCSVICGGDGHCNAEPGWSCEYLTDSGNDRYCFPGANDLCAPCGADASCPTSGAMCLELDDGNHCGRDCTDDGLCPDGYNCEARDGSDQCVPQVNSCSDCPGVDLETDTENCGACNRQCFATNATVGCSSGACVIDSCDAGFDSCDDNPSTGCETNLETRVEHCGACGSECAPPNATGQCVDGTCQILICNAGFSNEDGDIATGCEAGCLEDPLDIDVPDDQYIDKNCDGIHGTRDAAFFVAPDGSDGAAGDENAPFATIQHAVNAADENDERWQVLVAEGTYHERVDLPAGVSIFGGYDADTWLRSPTRNTIVNSPESVSLVVPDYWGADGWIDGFRFVAADAPDTGTRSSRAVILRDIPHIHSELIFRNNTVIAGRGADGKHGAHGHDGVHGSLGTRGEDGDTNGSDTDGGFGGFTQCPDAPNPGSGGRGGDGGSGANPGNIGAHGNSGGSSAPGGERGLAGAFAAGPGPCANCCATGHDGQSGQNGFDGAHGPNATRPDLQAHGTAWGFNLYDWRANAGVDGVFGDAGGGGGGGGGGAGLPVGGFNDVCAEHSGGAGGGGGAGGCGGPAGEAGTGAGGSIGIVTVNASGLTLENNHIITDDGGEGGAGGDGGLGGIGAEGRSGGDKSWRDAAGYSTYSSGSGGDGGDGGDGGHGGGASGGAGGMSTGILIVGSMSQSDLTMSGNTFDIGNPGSGGQGGLRGGSSTDRAQPGATGIQQTTFELNF